MVTHTCNPSYARGVCRTIEVCGKSARPFLKKQSNAKKGLGVWLKLLNVSLANMSSNSSTT
jgi:hypothetical protein